MNNSRQLLTAERALRILKGRKTITADSIGKRIEGYMVQGNGTFLTAEEQKAANPGQKNYFDKYIFNLNANNDVAVTDSKNKQLFAAAQALELAGQVEDADMLYRQWLNSCQVSFSVIVDGMKRKFEDGDIVSLEVAEVEARDGGKTLGVQNVRYVKPAVATKKEYDATALVADSFDQSEIDALLAALKAKRGVTV